MGDLQPITEVMITEITKYNKFQTEYFDANVRPVLVNARRYFSVDGRNSAKLNAESFRKVYITSDIHSDLRKFIELLVNAELITIPAGFNLFSNDIYNPELYTRTIWNKENVALVILGDLIDGKRSNDQVDDTRGNFELLLHIFLYNMKLKAIDKHSTIVFTLGNHDYHSCIEISDYIVNTYTPDSLKLFFGFGDAKPWVEIRQNALLPFYEVHPLMLVAIDHNKRHEMYGIHGGFHGIKKELIVQQLIKLQKQISAMNPETSLKTITSNPDFDTSFLSKKTDGIEDGGLWSRAYQDPSGCELIDSLDKNVVMIVVGHCPNIYKDILQAKTMADKPDLYAECQSNTVTGRGCVTLSCSNRLAHVDVAMSSAFHGYRPKHTRALRDAEMLVLKHDAGLKTDERYYNIVERFSKTGGVIEMYRAAAVAGGGRRAKAVTRRRKNKRRQTRRRR